MPKYHDVSAFEEILQSYTAQEHLCMHVMFYYVFSYFQSVRLLWWRSDVCLRAPIKMDKTNKIVNEETGSDDGKVLKAIEIVKEKNKGQYLNNISEICHAEYGWSQETTAAMLQRAQEQHQIHTVISYQKIAYRINSHPKVYIEDNRESIATQTEQDEIFCKRNSLDSLQNDLEDFKRFSHGEILSLKALLAPRQRESPHKSNGPNYEAPQEALIKSLQDRIKSLEMQLRDKQGIIEKLFEKLLEKPRPTESYNVNNNCHCIQSSLLGQNDSVEKRAQVPDNKESPQKKESNKPRPKEKKQKNMNNESTNSSAGSAPQETAKESNDRQHSKAEPSKADKKRKKIIIIGDSILNGLDELGLQRNHHVHVRAHPGANS